MNFRNAELLSKLETHPLRETLAAALDIAENYRAEAEFLKSNKDLSDQGRQKALQVKLRAAARDLRDARVPLVEMQNKLEAKRAAVKYPVLDQRGSKMRKEMRTVLRGMDIAQRAAALMIPEFADAMLEPGTHPLMSGISANEMPFVEEVRKERLKGLFAAELAEIDELETTVSEAKGICDLARVDLQDSSGMDGRVFEDFVKPIETKAAAPWLKRDKNIEGQEVIRVIDLERGTARAASPDEARDGKYYADHAEYLADRAAA